MAKTKRSYILATCFLSGAAAILSFVALGTQEWVTADARNPGDYESQGDYIKIGLFGGVFHQNTANVVTFELSTICSFYLNICASLCGSNMEENLEKLYNDNLAPGNYSCPFIGVDGAVYHQYSLRTVDTTGKKVFINAGIWICTIIFLIISAVMGLFSAALSVWNTATNPYQAYFSIFGLYIYNAIAFFSILISIILWGAMFAMDLIKMVPTYYTLLGEFTTDGYASLGYSYWLNLASLFLYICSISLLYTRNYLISKEPKKEAPVEDSAEPIIYLY